MGGGSVGSFSRVVAYPSSFIHPVAARLLGVSVLPPREHSDRQRKSPTAGVGVCVFVYIGLIEFDAFHDELFVAGGAGDMGTEEADVGGWGNLAAGDVGLDVIEEVAGETEHDGASGEGTLGGDNVHVVVVWVVGGAGVYEVGVDVAARGVGHDVFAFLFYAWRPVGGRRPPPTGATMCVFYCPHPYGMSYEY